MRKTDKINHIFAAFQHHNPEPKGELYYTNNFTLLIAVVLSAQATDKGVNKVTTTLFETIKQPQDILNMGYDTFANAIKSIGLYKTKAKNIMLLSKLLVEHYNGQVPPKRAALESLPGVGHKTASVVLNIGFHQPTIAVDTHVFRVSHRLGITSDPTREATEKKLDSLIPKRYKYHAHHWLILHGRYICQARRPKCELCFLTSYCTYFAKTVKPSL